MTPACPSRHGTSASSKPPSTIQAPHCRCCTSRALLLNSGFTMMNLVSEFARQTTSRRPKHTAMWMHNSIMRGKLCDEPSPGAQFDINFEVQQRGSPRIAFLRGSITEPLPRSAVEFRRDPIAIVLGEVGHALALGEILAHEAIGVFVGAAFPGVMWCGEVEAGRGRPLEPDIVVEFGAVIDGDGPHGMGLRGDEVLLARIHRGARALP